MTRQSISEIADRHLEAWLDRLMRGELLLGELPLSVEAFYHAGWAAAASVAQQQAREYEHKLELAYLQAYAPKDRAEVYQRRLDQHFKSVDAAFFAADVEDTNDSNSIRVAA